MKKHSTLKDLERRGARKSQRLMTKPVKSATQKASNKKHKGDIQNTEVTDTEIKMVTKADIGKKKRKKDVTAKKKIKDDDTMEDMLKVETMLLVDATAGKEELLETRDRSHDDDMVTEPFSCEKEVNGDSNEQFVCFMCRKKYKSQNALSVHYALGHKDYCVLCNIQFSSVQEKEEHLPTHNIFITDSGETIYGCETCGKKFTIKKNWQQHRATHDMVTLFECDICQQKLKTKNILHYHKRTVHCDAKEKKFKCEYCQKAFWSRSDMVIHIRVHTNDRPYLCHICSKAFKSAAHLLNHHKAVHEERVWLCDVCGEKFKTKRKYVTHGIISGHTKDVKPVISKDFTCEECGKAFKRKHDFNIHFRIHTGAKPYTCQECGMTFRCLSHLKQHRVVHTGEKPFKCKYCLKGFSQLANLNCHMKKCKNQIPLDADNNAVTVNKPMRMKNKIPLDVDNNAVPVNKPVRMKNKIPLDADNNAVTVNKQMNNVQTSDKGTSNTSSKIRGITLNKAKRTEMLEDLRSTNNKESDIVNKVVEKTIDVLLTTLREGKNPSDDQKLVEDYQKIFVNERCNITVSQTQKIMVNQSTSSDNKEM